MLTIHGIKNCDTMKKALAWLAERQVEVVFHDYKKLGVETAQLQRWCAALGWRSLVNTRGTTWRKLSPEQQSIADDNAAIALMIAQPSLIRRPLLATDAGRLLLGFDAARYADFLAGAPGDGVLPK